MPEMTNLRLGKACKDSASDWAFSGVLVGDFLVMAVSFYAILELMKVWLGCLVLFFLTRGLSVGDLGIVLSLLAIETGLGTKTSVVMRV